MLTSLVYMFQGSISFQKFSKCRELRNPIRVTADLYGSHCWKYETCAVLCGTVWHGMKTVYFFPCRPSVRRVQRRHPHPPTEQRSGPQLTRGGEPVRKHPPWWWWWRNIPQFDREGRCKRWSWKTCIDEENTNLKLCFRRQTPRNSCTPIQCVCSHLYEDAHVSAAKIIETYLRRQGFFFYF